MKAFSSFKNNSVREPLRFYSWHRKKKKSYQTINIGNLMKDYDFLKFDLLKPNIAC